MLFNKDTIFIRKKLFSSLVSFNNESFCLNIYIKLIFEKNRNFHYNYNETIENNK